MSRPRLLILSHVLPFPKSSGQSLRVHYMMAGLREKFHVTFGTTAPTAKVKEVEAKLAPLCDQSVVLPTVYPETRLGRLPHQLRGLAYQARTGLRRSNYVLSQIELSPSRVAAIAGNGSYDAVLYEYWYAAPSVRVFQKRGIPTILDMHNVLWRAYDAELKLDRAIPGFWRERQVALHRRHEEAAWCDFDGLVAINRDEFDYTRSVVPASRHTFYTPMGVELGEWPYTWNPATPPRVAYYGGMAAKRNQEGALRVLRGVMPEVWRKFPNAEYWIVGSKPPESIQALTRNPLIKVTGFVQDLPPLLGSMSVVVCPFDGTYGFRSRMVEVLAAGVPSVCTPDAVAGMELVEREAVLSGHTDAELASQTVSLLSNSALAARQSRHGREVVEQLFSYQNTYLALASDLSDWLKSRKETTSHEISCHIA